MASAAPTPPQSIRTIFATLALVLLLASLDQTIVSTALPTIASELGGLTHLSWVVTAYLLSSTIVGPLYGKFGDLYGRKVVLQTAIVIFLIGSVLSGVAQNMLQLILFRALQGIGGGGLIVTAIAVVGDIIAPRDRGRYQGIFGSVFGLSTIIGPLLGGFFVDHLTWRWIFYVNVPFGLIALAVIAVVFHSSPARRGHRIDYGGAVFLSASLTGLILFTSLGGTSFPWASPAILTLMAIGLIATAAFLFIETRASEPILPLSLFANRTFAISCSVAFVIGFALFGSITYLPIYLQVVKGVSPTESGLALMPMMVGLTLTSVMSGRIISRWGHYRPFPIAGTFLMTIGLTMLALLSPDSWRHQASADALVLGLGMGMVMQVLTMAVQNTVDYRLLGVATSGVSLFRAVGGAFGVAVFGAIFANGLHAQLSGPGIDFLTSVNPEGVRGLPPELQNEYIGAVMAALEPVYVVAAVVAAVGFVMTWFLREAPLRGVAPSAADSLRAMFPMPRDARSIDELQRILDNLSARENRWRNYAEVAERVGVDLSPQEVWMLYRLGEHAPSTEAELASELHVPQAELGVALADLKRRNIVIEDNASVVRLTPSGIEMSARMIAARARRLDELLERWEPERHPEVKALFERFREALIQELPRPTAAG